MKFIYKAQNLAAALQQGLADRLDKDSFLTLKLISDWNVICPELAEYTKPLRLHTKQGLLVVSVDVGNELAVQYKVGNILFAANKYFGKEYVKSVMLKKNLLEDKTDFCSVNQKLTEDSENLT